MLNPTLTLLALLSSAHALNWLPPRATPVAVSPFTAPEITPAPVVHHDLLHGRAAAAITTLVGSPDNTCGFFDGSAGAPLSCPKSDTCVMTKTQGGIGAVGCCPIGAPLSDCGFRVACIDADSYYNSTVCNGACLHDTHTLKCTASSAPYCNTISWPDDRVKDFFCDDIYVAGAQTLFTTYSGETGRTWETSLSNDATTTDSSTSESASDATTTESPTESTSTASTSTVPERVPATAAPAKSDPPAGAIAGGVVGGVAVIGIAVVAVIFLLRRSKNKAAAAAAAAGAAGPGGLSPPGYTQPDAAAMGAAAGGKYALSPDPNMQGYYAQSGQFVPQGAAAGGAYFDPNTQQYYAQVPQGPQMQQQPSPNGGHANPHLSGGYPDRGEATSPSNTARFSTAGTEGGAGQPRQGYSEMSANMAGGPFPQDQHVGTWEVEGSGVPPRNA